MRCKDTWVFLYTKLFFVFFENYYSDLPITTKKVFLHYEKTILLFVWKTTIASLWPVVLGVVFGLLAEKIIQNNFSISLGVVAQCFRWHLIVLKVLFPMKTFSS